MILNLSRNLAILAWLKETSKTPWWVMTFSYAFLRLFKKELMDSSVPITLTKKI